MKKYLLLCLVVLTGRLVSAQVNINPLQYTIYYESAFPIDPNAEGNTVSVTLKDTYNNILAGRSTFADSFFIVQGQNLPTTINFTFEELYWHESCYYDYDRGDVCTYWQEPAVTNTKNITLRYPYSDTTIATGGGNYITIHVRPNMDNTNNLPTDEKIRMVNTGSYPYYGYWQYQVGASTDWLDVPSYLYASNINMLDISGYDLFGLNYVSYLNQTVKFRIKYNQYNYWGSPTENSNIVVFTHRLSAPKILSVTTNNLNCFEVPTGSITIQFSRALLGGERLNLFLNDTLRFGDYSALNIQSLSGSNTYTWTGELPASNYLLSMIGKYDPNLVNDLVLTNRGFHFQYPREYWAQNSITFNPGFETATVDSFETFIGGLPGGIPATYTGSIDHFKYFTLTQPPRVQYYLQLKNNVLCKGGNNGTITVYAKGGVGNFKYGIRKEGESNVVWTNFSNNTIDPVSGHVKHDVTGLTAGIYHINVRDANDCMLRDSIGTEIKRTLTITEPAEALRLELLEVTPITSIDSVNGKIKVRLAGGTPYFSTEIPGYKYIFEWRDSATNQLVPNVVRDTLGGKFELRLANLNQGTYVLKATDNKYGEVSGSFDRSGCFVQTVVRLVKPAALAVSIVSQTPITCNGGTNGVLKAVASGGHQIDSTRYVFTWFKNGTQVATGTDSTLINAGAGQYTVEIQDKFSTKKTSVAYTLTQPVTMQLTPGSVAASCFSTANGSVSVAVTGGVAPYRYEWSTGATTPSVTGLPGGNYVVVVKDTLGCEAVVQASITSPVQVIAVPTVTPVTCVGKADGRIQLAVSGGVAPYTYQWSNGSTTSLAQNLPVGRHWFKVSDANGCFTTDTLDLDAPQPFSVTLDPNMNICIGQVVQLRTAITGTGPVTYSWSGSNGLSGSTPMVNVTQAGTYIVTATNQRNCVMKDTIVLTSVSSSINTDFVVSTQSFRDDNVVLVNISTPTPDSVQWTFPALNTITVLQRNRSFAELVFADTGRYEIAMKVFYPSGCVDVIRKQVIVVNKEPFANVGNQAQAYLKRFAVYPNPNNGQFNVELLFNDVTKARLRLVNILTNVTVNDRTVEGLSSYLINYNYGGIIAGTYVLVIDTPKGSFVHKVTVQ
jgi:hypothetical protein